MIDPFVSQVLYFNATGRNYSIQFGRTWPKTAELAKVVAIPHESIIHPRYFLQTLRNHFMLSG
jgi:hypothetical protein